MTWIHPRWCWPLVNINPPLLSLSHTHSISLSHTHIVNWFRPILACSKRFNLSFEREVGKGRRKQTWSPLQHILPLTRISQKKLRWCKLCKARIEGTERKLGQLTQSSCSFAIQRERERESQGEWGRPQVCVWKGNSSSTHIWWVGLSLGHLPCLVSGLV